MSIEFTCSQCQKTLRVPSTGAGKKCRCPSCNALQNIPSNTILQAAAPAKSDSVSADSAASERRVIDCPKCQSQLAYTADLEGTRGMCKGCGNIFTLSQSAVFQAATESFPFQCPNCKFMFEGKPGMEGKRGKCTECNSVFSIQVMERPKSQPAIPPASPSPAPAQRPAPANSKAIGNANATGVPPSTQPRTNPPTPSRNIPSQPVSRPTVVIPTPIAPAGSSNTEGATKSDNIWDQISIPTTNWESQPYAANPYAASPSYSAPKSSGPKRLKKSELESLAYWHRALITSFVISLAIGIVIGICNVSLIYLVQAFLTPENRETLIVMSRIYVVLVLIAALVSLVFSIRFMVSYIVICTLLFEGASAVLFILGYFLFCIPLLPLIVLIVVLMKASQALKSAGYEVGFFGVDPSDV